MDRAWIGDFMPKHSSRSGLRDEPKVVWNPTQTHLLGLSGVIVAKRYNASDASIPCRAYRSHCCDP